MTITSGQRDGLTTWARHVPAERWLGEYRTWQEIHERVVKRGYNGFGPWRPDIYLSGSISRVLATKLCQEMRR
jgi:hypothetical protein